MAAVGFIGLAYFASRFAYFPIDLTITRWVQTFHPAWFYTFMVLVSWPGYLPQAIAVVIVLVSILYFAGLRRDAYIALSAAAGEALLDEVIKLFVHRPRPPEALVHVSQILHSYSFPSGHVMFYTVFFGFFMYLACSRLRVSILRWGVLALFGGLMGSVGISRIYLGEHWASDVLGAYLLGSLCLMAVIRIYRRREVSQPIQ